MGPEALCCTTTFWLSLFVLYYLQHKSMSGLCSCSPQRVCFVMQIYYSSYINTYRVTRFHRLCHTKVIYTELSYWKGKHICQCQTVITLADWHGGHGQLLVHWQITYKFVIKCFAMARKQTGICLWKLSTQKWQRKPNSWQVSHVLAKHLLKLLFLCGGRSTYVKCDSRTRLSYS